MHCNLAGCFLLEEPDILFLCLNISTSASGKLVRPHYMFELFDLVFLYTFFSKFTKWFRICLKESVPTVSSAAMAVYIFFVWHGKNKDQRENKTTILSSCFLLLLSRWAFINVACRINFLRMRAISYCLLSIAEKWDGSNNSNSFLALIVKSGN